MNIFVKCERFSNAVVYMYKGVTIAACEHFAKSERFSNAVVYMYKDVIKINDSCEHFR